jgi:hypothetical protein
MRLVVALTVVTLSLSAGLAVAGEISVERTSASPLAKS